MDEALLADIGDEYAALDALVAGRSAAEWDRPTPAEGWSVADTIAHLASSEQAAAASVAHDIDPVTAPSGASHHLGTHDPEELLARWRRNREATLEALAGCPPDARVPWGGRRMAARSLAVARLMETWAHGLDCAAALEAPMADSARLEHVAWLGHRSLPYAFAVAGVAPPEPPSRLRLELDAPDGGRWIVGAADGPTITGPAGDWCRVVTHRLRPPATSSLVARGPLATSALEVARAFL